MAGMTDKYPHLPGHLTEFKDGGLQLVADPTPAQTESLLILGTACDGPVMEPVKVDASTFESVFGKVVDERNIPNGATLGQAFEEAWNAGCRDIRLMRVSGSTATASVKCAQDIRKVESISEGTLGLATGNTAANSKIELQQTAKEIAAVKVNGISLLASDYTVEQEPIADKYINPVDGTVVEASTLSNMSYIVINDETVFVAQATEAISKHNTTGEYKKSADVSADETADYSTVISVGDYIKVVEDAEDYAGMILDAQPGSDEVVTGKGVDSIIYIPATTTIITIKDDVADNGSFVDVRYINMAGLTISENSNVTGTYMINGDTMEFDLPAGVVPYDGLTKLYINDVEYIESDTTSENADVKVFEVVKTTVDDVETAKIKVNPGSHAKRGAEIEYRCPYLKSEEFVAVLKLETAFGGSIYNSTQFIVETKTYSPTMVEKILKITKPRSKRSSVNEEPLTYSSFDYPTLGLLARAINNDDNNGGFVKAYVNTKDSQTSTSGLESSTVATVFTGGTDGLNISNQEMFNKLSGSRDAEGFLVEQGAYQILENYTVDYVVPAGIYADTELAGRNDDFAYELALFCAVVSHRNHTTIGCIATSSPDEPTLKAIEEHVEHLEAYDNTYLMKDKNGDVIRDSDGNGIDLGKHICIIAGGDTILVNQRLGVYAANSAAAFVGYITTLPTNTSPTNKVVSYAGGLKIKYSNAQLDRLTEKRYITLKYKGDTNVAIVDAMTSALENSDYQKLSTFRAVRTMANETREVADPFLGEPNTPEQRNALAALLDKRYSLLKEAGTIKDYSFNIICTALDELVGAAKISLTIVPAQELTQITTVIALKPSI